MFRKFLPKRDIFFDLFEKHAILSCEAAKKLSLFYTSGQEAEFIFQNIKHLEHEADTITHHCIEALHKTFITPMDRMDIHRLISSLDDIADEIEDVARSMVLYKLGHFRPDAVQLTDILIASTQEVHAAIKEFRKMKLTAQIKQHVFKINHLENEADTVFMQALSNLFEEEKDPKTLIKWKEVYEHLEKTTDLCEDVSNILEGIILENE